MCLEKCPQNVLLLLIGIVEIIACVMGITALGINSLITTDVSGLMYYEFNNTVNSIGDGYCGTVDVGVEIQLNQFQFGTEFDILQICSNLVNCTQLGAGDNCRAHDTYNYEKAEDAACKNDSSSNECSTSKAIATASSAYIGLATAGSVLLGVTGLFLIGFSLARRYCCNTDQSNNNNTNKKKKSSMSDDYGFENENKKEKAQSSHRCIRCCTTYITELTVMAVNLICTVLFFVGFLLALLLRVVNGYDVDGVIEDSLNDLYLIKQIRIEWDVDLLKDGGSVGPMATAFVICFIVFSYMACSAFCTSLCGCCRALCYLICCQCCRSSASASNPDHHSSIPPQTNTAQYNATQVTMVMQPSPQLGTTQQPSMAPAMTTQQQPYYAPTQPVQMQLHQQRQPYVEGAAPVQSFEQAPANFRPHGMSEGRSTVEGRGMSTHETR